jgi:CubicO group peptidase (beta-lactamase class C family)
MVARSRRLLLALTGTVVLALGVGGYYVHRLILIGAAYDAKMLCSGVFVSGRDAATVEHEDIAANQHSVLQLIRARVDRQQRSVSAGLFGLPQREAVFRDGLGCTLAIGVTADQLRADSTGMVASRRIRTDRPWPEGDAVELRHIARAINTEALYAALDAAFTEPDPTRPRRTRAVVVVYDGRIVAERYAPGFSLDTPQIGWSMTKSVTGALVGVLVGEGKLALNQPAPVSEWRQSSDPRGAITLDQLLRMNSGLAFDENYGAPLSDVVYMLLGTRDMAAYAIAKPLVAAPGSTWHYSTGTSNILARIVHDTGGISAEAQRSFPRRALFDRIGMTSAVLEPDASGIYAGSSFMYASARDWARFGLLCLRDGLWNGAQILPPGWVKYSRTPTTQSPDNEFGAHLWLRVPEPYYRAAGMRPTLPSDAFHIVGHHAQFVSVVPSRKLVVVRLGLSAPWTWDQEEFLVQILRAVPARN